jgi:hypothetical protein
MAIGLVSGFVATKAMTRVTTRLYEMESEEDKQREKEASPGISYDVAAKQLAARIGLHLDEQQARQVGGLFHWGLGLGAGILYMNLRRRGTGPIKSAVVASMSLFLGIDEGLTPAMGWSAPDPKYPLATHVRGLIGHLTLGATVLVVAEPLRKLLGG